MKLCGPGLERPPHCRGDGACEPPPPSQGAGAWQEPPLLISGPHSISYFRSKDSTVVPGGCPDLKASLEHSGGPSESCKHTAATHSEDSMPMLNKNRGTERGSSRHAQLSRHHLLQAGANLGRSVFLRLISSLSFIPFTITVRSNDRDGSQKGLLRRFIVLTCTGHREQNHTSLKQAQEKIMPQRLCGQGVTRHTVLQPTIFPSKKSTL